MKILRLILWSKLSVNLMRKSQMTRNQYIQISNSSFNTLVSMMTAVKNHLFHHHQTKQTSQLISFKRNTAIKYQVSMMTTSKCPCHMWTHQSLIAAQSTLINLRDIDRRRKLITKGNSLNWLTWLISLRICWVMRSNKYLIASCKCWMRMKQSYRFNFLHKTKKTCIHINNINVIVTQL